MEDKTLRFEENNSGDLKVINFFDIHNPIVITKTGLIPVEIVLSNGNIYESFVDLKELKIDEEKKAMVLILENRLIQIDVLMNNEETKASFIYK